METAEKSSSGKDDDDGLLVENRTSSDVAGSTTMPSHTTRYSKPKVRYLLESRLSAEMPKVKLPKNRHVLWRFLELYEEKAENAKQAAEKAIAAKVVSVVVAQEVREVWTLHFGVYVTHGKNSYNDIEDNEGAKIVIRQDNIEAKILKLYHDYSKLEQESKRPARCGTASFKAKEEAFSDRLDTPMDIAKENAEEKLRESPIMDWREDWQHLQNQLQRNQKGCLGLPDFHQKKRDERAIKDMEGAEKSAEKSKQDVNKLFEKRKQPDGEQVEDDEKDD